jgi:Fe2+ or Zn2+ uptake regulation protein
VFDVGETSLVTDDIRELTKTGYTVESKYILYYGICPECSDKTIGD